MNYEINKESVKVSFPPQSVLMTVGPTGCGKTTFAKRLVKKTPFGMRAVHISSDHIRQELLGQDVLKGNLHKYDNQMMQVSHKAFEKLWFDLRMAMQYPYPADLIVLDTTGLNEEFRETVEKICKENYYACIPVVFEYKKFGDYFDHLTDQDQNRKLIARHLERLREYQRTMKRPKNGIIKVKSPFTEPEIDPASTAHLKRVREYAPSRRYDVIGDIHGCWEEFTDLVQKLGYTINDHGINAPEGSKLILAGDVIDKGPKSREVAKLILNSPDVVLVLGNHENFANYAALDMDEAKGPPTEVREKYFNMSMEKDEDWIQTVKYLMEKAVPFYEFANGIVTHSPCKRGVLGKMHPNAVREQNRGLRYPEVANADELHAALDDKFAEIFKDAQRNEPLHIFGHIASVTPIVAGNQIGIDTGCVHGNKLTAVSVLPNGRYFFTQVPAKQTYFPKDLYRKAEKVMPETDTLWQKLDPQSRKAIARMFRSGVNYVSATMSPSDKLGDELESLEAGLRYFQNQKVEHLLIQPKYMGSRCQIYLYPHEVEKSYGVSRNGIRIRHVDLSPVLPTLTKLVSSWQDLNFTECYVFDGELLPWTAMGKGLVEEQFDPVAKCLGRELKARKANGFLEALQASKETQAYVNFREQKNSKTKKDWIDQIGHAQYTTLSALAATEMRSYAEDEADLEKYRQQVELYGSDAPLEYRPFNLLKVAFKNGEEWVNDKSLYDLNLFGMDNTLPLLVTEENFAESLEKAKRFYSQVTTGRRMEGVVIKPAGAIPRGCAAYLKVRNSEYLRIVYGYDYLKPSKYQRLLGNKRIGGKRRTSIREHELGQKLLSIPLKDLAPEDRQSAFPNGYVQIAANILEALKDEKSLDPRL